MRCMSLSATRQPLMLIAAPFPLVLLVAVSHAVNDRCEVPHRCPVDPGRFAETVPGAVVPAYAGNCAENTGPVGRASSSLVVVAVDIDGGAERDLPRTQIG